MKLLGFNCIFPDEASCEDYFRNLREEREMVCPSGGGIHHYWDRYSKR